MKPLKWIALRSYGNKSWMFAAMLAAALLFAGAPRAAAQVGTIAGQILDVTGKPWAEIAVEAVSDQGAKVDAKTDKDGNFAFHNLRTGVYTVTVVLPAPNPPYLAAKVQVTSGAETPKVNLNFKDIVSKQGAEAVEQQKKQEEEKQKFQGMKQHFDAGAALLTQLGQAKADLAKAPADQRDALKQQVTDLSNKAVTELEASKSAAPEKD